MGRFKVFRYVVSTITFILSLYFLVSCSGTIGVIPSVPSQLYYKDNGYINIRYDPTIRVFSLDGNFYIDKNNDSDIGAVLEFSGEGTDYQSYYGVSGYFRKWFKSDKIVFGNIGVGGHFSTSLSRIYGYTDQLTRVYLIGVEGFASLGYFGEVVGVSLISRLGSGMSILSTNSQSDVYIYFGTGPNITFNLPYVSFGGEVNITVGSSLGTFNRPSIGSSYIPIGITSPLAKVFLGVRF